MKNVSKLIGITLAVVSLLFTACKKKPVRTPVDPSQTGHDNSFNVDPTKEAQFEGPQIPVRLTDEKPDMSGKSVVEPIYFALDRYAVAPAERSKLDAAIKWLKDNPEKNLVLTGFCDWRGTAEYNLGLGENRANSVKRYLESLGADGKRLETLSKGSTEAKQGGSESEWAKDRRVDFVELKKQ